MDTDKLRALHAELVEGEQALPWRTEHCNDPKCWCRLVVGIGKSPSPFGNDFVIPMGAVNKAQAEAICFVANDLPRLLDELDELRAKVKHAP